MPAASRLVFRPRRSFTLLALPLIALMVAAGFWQRSRGIEKQALLAAHEAAVHQAPAPIDTLPEPPTRGQRLPAKASGRYLADQGLLLDNQSDHGLPGTHAWSVFETSDGVRFVVDRGWLPLDKPATAPPTGAQSITGLWRRLPEPGLRLDAAATGSACAAVTPNTRANYPDIVTLRCLWGTSLRDGLLELDASADGGFGRQWIAEAEAVPPMRHYAYAAQWWLFAATLLFFYVRLSLRRVDAAHDSTD